MPMDIAASKLVLSTDIKHKPGTEAQVNKLKLMLGKWKLNLIDGRHAIPRSQILPEAYHKAYKNFM